MNVIAIIPSCLCLVLFGCGGGGGRGPDPLVVDESKSAGIGLLGNVKDFDTHDQLATFLAVDQSAKIASAVGLARADIPKWKTAYSGNIKIMQQSDVHLGTDSAQVMFGDVNFYLDWNNTAREITGEVINLELVAATGLGGDPADVRTEPLFTAKGQLSIIGDVRYAGPLDLMLWGSVDMIDGQGTQQTLTFSTKDRSGKIAVINGVYTVIADQTLRAQSTNPTHRFFNSDHLAAKILAD